MHLHSVCWLARESLALMDLEFDLDSSPVKRSKLRELAQLALLNVLIGYNPGRPFNEAVVVTRIRGIAGIPWRLTTTRSEYKLLSS